jgi:hypothetical protein
MTLLEAARGVASALARATDDHARPNSYACGELLYYGGPAASLCGRVGRDPALSHAVYATLGGRGHWGSAPVYHLGRWYV